MITVPTMAKAPSCQIKHSLSENLRDHQSSEHDADFCFVRPAAVFNTDDAGKQPQHGADQVQILLAIRSAAE